MSKPAPLIFLIDDVVQNLQVLSETLRKEGFQISGASNGATALQMLQQVHPDLILCDIIMPNMDGYHVAQQLQSNPTLCDIPLIFLTARTESEDILKGFSVGGVDYITKPFNTAELIARVKNHLALKQARDTIAKNMAHLRLLNEEKDKFLNIAAHDLRNPLNSIVMITDSIHLKQGHVAPEKLMDYAETISQDANRMLLIITNLLDVNKIESGQINAQLQPSPIYDLFSRLKREYQAIVEKKKIVLNVTEPDKDCQIMTDPLLLFQLLDNLLSNAIKFSEPGQAVWLRFLKKSDHVWLEIEDHGPGFKPEEQSKMFHKFARLSAQPTAGEASTGLGLAIVQLLANLLKLPLSYTTAPHQGTCFRLKVPLAH